jgi:AcrR family transcriptional regulator
VNTDRIVGLKRPMRDAKPNNRQRRSSLRDQQVDLTRDLIVRAFQELLRNDHPDAITYPQVAEAAGVSLRTVYRYFPTRADLLQSAMVWLTEFIQHARLDDPRTVCDLAGVVPEMGRIFDEHTNVFRAIAEADEQRDEPRRRAVATAIAEVSGNLPPGEGRRAEAILDYLRSGRAWVVLHDRYGLDGDEILAALDWAATTLLDDLRRRNTAAASTSTTSGTNSRPVGRRRSSGA